MRLNIDSWKETFNTHFLQYTATEIMVEDVQTKGGAGSISIRWKSRRYLPQSYVIMCSCKVVGIEENNFDQTYHLYPNTRSFEILNLTSKSECSLNFKAVYNPASLDPGISLTITTLDLGIQQFFFYI